mmetsp:Transcript_5914/g.17468  ORF Transcript_5914/g.17468 Transcript_5914/m.17468 type:complete len:153 (-) Transcript_5914:33-491(-)|eukprot:CAMPEP_0119272556 /NCGR_PEP_ID=MMETSP1329-20130426/8716_1 /TAXON_ID=114041 /ORGANISM="Genus nov. species nov., Strain RCC1024" /LENGTH=152 /DNA_ID=CAMNT_0007272625 /DNA_START=61 /DNA_END=519 /DNA_ORIENTATION=+
MALPGSQTWMLVRNSSCFLVKRNGVQFTTEPGNVMNLNTFKYSGLANDKTIDISADKFGKVSMGLKAPKRATKPATSVNVTPLNKTLKVGKVRGSVMNMRKVAKSITSQTAGKFYRGDLTAKAIARAAALDRAGKVQAGLAKKAKTKKGRKA